MLKHRDLCKYCLFCHKKIFVLSTDNRQYIYIRYLNINYFVLSCCLSCWNLYSNIDVNSYNRHLNCNNCLETDNSISISLEIRQNEMFNIVCVRSNYLLCENCSSIMLPEFLTESNIRSWYHTLHSVDKQFIYQHLLEHYRATI